MTLRELLDHCVKEHMRSQWLNFRRQINEPAAREELLSCGTVHFYNIGTVNPAVVTRGAVAIPNPSMFDCAGEMETDITLPLHGCEAYVRRMDGESVVRCVLTEGRP